MLFLTILYNCDPVGIYKLVGCDDDKALLHAKHSTFA